MSTFAKLKSTDLKRIAKLIHQKELLQQKVAAINESLDSLESGALPAKPIRKAVVSPKRSKRGKLKSQILAALKEAGKKGHTVAELSQKLKVKTNNLYSWFYITGKKVAGLKKSKDGRYSL